MSETVLYRDLRGEVVASGNELSLRDLTKDGDPVAVRFYSKNETVGKLSVNVPAPDGAMREVGFIGVKRDERGRTDPAHQGALEVEFWTHIPGRPWDDSTDGVSNFTRMFGIRHDGVVFYQGGSAAVGWELRHPDGVFWCVMQGDGNFVGYRNRLAFDYGTGEPVFDWFTMRDALARVAALEARIIALESR